MSYRISTLLRAVGTLRRSPCGSWWRAACLLPAESSEPAERSRGPGRCERVPCSMSKARSSKCGRRALGRTAVWSPSAARLATRSAKSSTCSTPSSSCRGEYRRKGWQPVGEGGVLETPTPVERAWGKAIINRRGIGVAPIQYCKRTDQTRRGWLQFRMVSDR